MSVAETRVTEGTAFKSPCPVSQVGLQINLGFGSCYSVLPSKEYFSEVYDLGKTP